MYQSDEDCEFRNKLQTSHCLWQKNHTAINKLNGKTQNGYIFQRMHNAEALCIVTALLKFMGCHRGLPGVINTQAGTKKIDKWPNNAVDRLKKIINRALSNDFDKLPL